MLRRKIQDTLLQWKNTPGHKPLVIKGCRQCGKTFSVREFAKKNYKHEVYLNFLQDSSYASIFSGSLEVDHLVILKNRPFDRSTPLLYNGSTKEALIMHNTIYEQSGGSYTQG